VSSGGISICMLPRRKYGGQLCANPNNIYIAPTWSYTDNKETT